MRKDKGLSTDLDRLPILTWIMFLKFIDDLEQLRETEVKLEGKRFRPAIEPPYRWRDWAAKADGITGDALIAFIQNDEATGPCGPRPRVVQTVTRNGAALQVRVAASPLNGGGSNALSQIRFGAFQNATVTFNGQAVAPARSCPARARAGYTGNRRHTDEQAQQTRSRPHRRMGRARGRDRRKPRRTQHNPSSKCCCAKHESMHAIPLFLGGLAPIRS
jgi:hypothetical protein